MSTVMAVYELLNGHPEFIMSKGIQDRVSAALVGNSSGETYPLWGMTDC